jgi:hypothetical protein
MVRSSSAPVAMSQAPKAAASQGPRAGNAYSLRETSRLVRLAVFVELGRTLSRKVNRDAFLFKATKSS